MNINEFIKKCKNLFYFSNKVKEKEFKLKDHPFFDCQSKGDCKAPKCYCEPKEENKI